MSEIKKLEKKTKLKTYPEQSQYVKGNKIWLELPTGQTIIISSQARDVLNFYHVKEETFIRKLKELLAECFTNLHEDKGFVYSFERLSVSKATLPETSDEEAESPYIKIEIFDCFGKKEVENHGKT